MARFPDGVWLAELAPLTDPGLVSQTVATALGLKGERQRSIVEAVIGHLREKTALLILDNCEHLIDACAELATRLLESCAHVRILATSREVLGIDGEASYRVPSLGLPAAEASPAPEVAEDIEAVRLFVDRVQDARQDFALTELNCASVVEICRRLDGIPLAIELAAARAQVMSAEEIASRLDERFRLLRGGRRGRLARHRTLQALIDWSYEQLTEPEQALLRRLAVFAGGWTLEAAESVCGLGTIGGWQVLDLLTQLVDKSLAERGPATCEVGGTPRFRLLETVRAYAEDRLQESGETAETRHRHRKFFVALVEDAEPYAAGADQSTWLSRLEAEHDNLRAAMTESEGDNPEIDATLAAGLQQFWEIRGYWSEGRRFSEALLNSPGAEARTRSRCKMLGTAARFAELHGDYHRARSLFEENLEINRELGDQRATAASLANLAGVAYDLGDFDRARCLYEESLSISRDLDDNRGIARALGGLGDVARGQGDFDRARDLFGESLGMSRELGDGRSIAQQLNNLGNVALWQGDFALARTRYEDSLAIKLELGDKKGTSSSLQNLGIVAANEGDYERARSLFNECLQVNRELEDKQAIARTLNNLGNTALNQDDYESARSLLKEGLAINQEIGDKRGISSSFQNMGIVAKGQGDYDRAQSLIEASLAISRELEDKSGIAASLESLGSVALDQGSYDQARSLYEESLAIKRQQEDTRACNRALDNLGRVALSRGDYDQARSLYEESLSINQEMEDKHGIAESLEGLGIIAHDQGHYDRAHSCLEKSLAISRELGEKGGISRALNGMGKVARDRGDCDRAHALFQESLGISWETRARPLIAAAIVGLGTLAHLRGDLAGATRLIAAALALAETMQLAFGHGERQEIDDHVSTLRDELGGDAYGRESSAGAAISLADVVTHSLKTTAGVQR